MGFVTANGALIKNLLLQLQIYPIHNNSVLHKKSLGKTQAYQNILSAETKAITNSSALWQQR
jgi:hypothetical protein